MVIIHELIESLFLGFGVFILVSSFIRPKSDDKKEALNTLTDSAVVVIRFVAIAFLLDWGVRLYFQVQSEDEYYSLRTRMFGAFWLAYWTYPISYGIFPQVFWIKRVSQMKVMRVVSAVLILFSLHVEKGIILITSLHRDYVPSSWAPSGSTLSYYYLIVYDRVLELIVFGVVLAVVHWWRGKRERWRNA